MPEVEEVFRLATNKVKPDPNALERQVRRQRASARTSRAWAYAAVAAVVVLAAIGAVVFAGTRPDVSPGDQSTGQTIPPSVASLAPGATPQSTEIFSIDGHSVATIQGLPLDARGLTVSADGSTIAFVTTPEGSSTNQVATIHADGTGLMVLSTPGLDVPDDLGGAAISPDGSQVAFTGRGDDGNLDIYVMNADGSGVTRLTTDGATEQFPQWSPDGRTIAYGRVSAKATGDVQFDGSADVWTVPAAGGSPTQITASPGMDNAPSFSPDGQTIAYMSANDGLRLIDADGTNARTLSGMWRSGGYTPRFSPDGRTIAVTRYVDTYRPVVAMHGGYEQQPLVTLALVDVATGRVTKLPKVAMASDYNIPAWLPGSDQLLIRSVPPTDPSA